MGEIRDPLDGFNQLKTWNLKKKMAPKNTLEATAAK